MIAVYTLLSLRILFLTAVIVGAGCSRLPRAGDFHVGATRQEIVKSFGEPSREQLLRKTGEAVWGPIEGFWSQVPHNSTVEIWDYRVEGGTVELYFIDGSNRIQGTGFAPQGAVFESGY